MVRNSGIPFTSTIADTLDIGTGVVDYLVDGYDKIDKFKNNLISGRKKENTSELKSMYRSSESNQNNSSPVQSYSNGGVQSNTQRYSNTYSSIM